MGLASALFEEFGHERKKLEKIRGQVVEDHEEGIKEESGELDRTLQSLLLWTFSQTNKFPGVRHVPRCQKVIKELSIGVSLANHKYFLNKFTLRLPLIFRIKQWNKWLKIQMRKMLE